MNTTTVVAIIGAVVAIIGAAISIIQLVYYSRKQKREKREAQARFAYELLDDLFDDPLAWKLLEELDYGARSSDDRPADRPFDLGGAFHEVLGGSADQLSMAEQSRVYEHIDALLFRFDRFEHAIKAKLTRFKDVQTPTGYYVTLMSPSRTALDAYATRVGYGRAVVFLSRFKAVARL